MEKQVRTLTDGVRAILLHSGFPHNFWPLAASFFCIAMNLSETNGMSPYEKAHNSKYTGLQVHFGMLVYLRPIDLGKKSKFEPRLHTGAFVGWHVQPDMNVTSDYLIIAIEDFHRKAKGEIKTLPVHRVREVRVLGKPHFPLEEYAWAREADPTARYLPDDDGEDPYLMLGDDEPDGDETIDLPQLADKPAELTYVPGQSASSSGAVPEPGTSDDGQSSSQGVKRKLLPDECLPSEEQLVDAARLQDEEMYPALPVKVDEWRATRVILEFCCNDDSLMGHAAYRTDNCLVVRLTKTHDMTSQSGLDFALKCPTDVDPSVYCFMWASMPCAGASPWQRLNAKRPGGQAKIDDHLQLHHALLNSWKQLVDAVRARGGDLALERPRDCEYWRLEHVTEALDKYSMSRATFDGCALGLFAKPTCLPIRKPWAVATTAPILYHALEANRCPGHAQHTHHARDQRREPPRHARRRWSSSSTTRLLRRPSRPACA